MKAEKGGPPAAEGEFLPPCVIFFLAGWPCVRVGTFPLLTLFVAHVMCAPKLKKFKEGPVRFFLQRENLEVGQVAPGPFSFL